MRMMDCFFEVLHKTIQFARDFNEGTHRNFDEIRLEIDRTIAENANYINGGYSEDQYHLSLFAIVAFIDETFLLSSWENKKEWKKDLLQVHHFQCVNAGESFFQKLDQLSAFNPAEKDIREVYYYCLTLGFKGKYFRDRDQAFLNTLIRNNLELLVGVDTHSDAMSKEKRLFPEGYIPGDEGTGIKNHIDWRPFVTGVPIVFLLILFFLLKVEIFDAVNYLVTTI
jgi:type VI secretion system protein ImpK